MRVRISPDTQPLPQDLGGPDLVPGSKSHTQRAMLLAAFLPGERKIKGALRARDTEVLAKALDALGARTRWTEKALVVRGREGLFPDGDVDLAQNGTALRMLLAIVPMLGGRLVARGDPSLLRRPLGESLALLEQAGVAASVTPRMISVDARHARWPTRVEVDASTTTQVASGALIGAALHAYWTATETAVVVTDASAPGYVDLTAAALADCGFEVAESGDAKRRELRVLLGSRSTLCDFKVPRDASSVAFVRVLAALHGREAPPWVVKLPAEGHPDERIAEDLAKLARAKRGARVMLADLALRPDCVPALAVLAATRPCETRIERVPALRGKESDRIAALAKALGALGVACEELADGLVVRGPLPAREGQARCPVPDDHRVVMALALLGTLLPDGIVLEHGDAVGKSWPSFWEWLGRLARVEK